MPLDVRREGTCVVVAPRDEHLDPGNADAFRDELLELVEAGYERIVVDLAGVSAIDSGGLAALVLVLKRVAAGGALVLCNVREVPRSVFRLTRLDRVFRSFPSEEEALRAVGA